MLNLKIKRIKERVNQLNEKIRHKEKLRKKIVYYDLNLSQVFRINENLRKKLRHRMIQK